MNDTNKKRMTLIPEDNSESTESSRVRSQYRTTHRRHHSQKSKDAYRKKHPVKFFFFGTKERRLRTALTIAGMLTIIIVILIYPLLFSPYTNKSASPDSICSEAKCSKPVARTGDTNYCTSHSAKCQGCNCYIDAYATYCRDCMEKTKSEFSEN